MKNIIEDYLAEPTAVENKLLNEAFEQSGSDPGFCQGALARDRAIKAVLGLSREEDLLRWCQLQQYKV